jgi:protoheme ferro-lyase
VSPSYLNVSIALIVFMGLVSGGMLALVLMTTRRYQVSFSIILGLALLLAVGGVFASVSVIENLAQGLTNAIVLLILSFALGYTLTTFSVLSYSNKRIEPFSKPEGGDLTAVIALAPGEPPEYGVESASRRLALADDPQDAPPVLLRPFYLRDLRSKYAHVGPSPYRESYNELVRKVQSRLDSSHRVYVAYYSDKPGLAETAAGAIEEGAQRIVVVHVRVTDPPDPVMSGHLLQGLRPESHDVELVEVGPLWDSDLLPQIYVRRVLEAVPQVEADPQDVGLLLVGRGHVAGEPEQSSSIRYRQEFGFQQKVRQALIKMGFDETRVTIGWLRSHEPSVPEAFLSLVSAGCKTVVWMPSSFPADGVNTLYDIPAQLDPLAKTHGIRLAPLGAWNADDLAAEEIAARVRAEDSAPSLVPARALP